MAKYCGSECQRSNWIHHKGLCGEYSSYAKRLAGQYDDDSDDDEWKKSLLGDSLVLWITFTFDVI